MLPEDSRLRIQNRLSDVTEDAPANVHFCAESRIPGDGLTEQLEQFLAEHPDTSLTIIDTLRMIRGTTCDSTHRPQWAQVPGQQSSRRDLPQGKPGSAACLPTGGWLLSGRHGT